jgi:outer membrane lipoprotein carrier protein
MLKHTLHNEAFWVWRHLLLLVLLLGIPRTSYALDLAPLIDKVQSAYDNTKALTADFVQIATLNSINRHQTSAGRLFIAKPASIRWEYTQPDAQTILYDGTLLRIYTPKRHQVLQTPINEQDRHNVALLFLAGIGKIRETFDIKQLSSTESDKPILHLLPRSNHARFKELHITINIETFLVEKITIHDTIGNVTNIHLYSLKTHETLPPHTFKLDIPPHTEILTPMDFSGQKR